MDSSEPWVSYLQDLYQLSWIFWVLPWELHNIIMGSITILWRQLHNVTRWIRFIMSISFANKIKETKMHKETYNICGDNSRRYTYYINPRFSRQPLLKDATKFNLQSKGQQIVSSSFAAQQIVSSSFAA